MSAHLGVSHSPTRMRASISPSVYSSALHELSSASAAFMLKAYAEGMQANGWWNMSYSPNRSADHSFRELGEVENASDKRQPRYARRLQKSTCWRHELALRRNQAIKRFVPLYARWAPAEWPPTTTRPAFGSIARAFWNKLCCQFFSNLLHSFAWSLRCDKCCDLYLMNPTSIAPATSYTSATSGRFGDASLYPIETTVVPLASKGSSRGDTSARDPSCANMVYCSKTSAKICMRISTPLTCQYPPWIQINTESAVMGP